MKISQLLNYKLSNIKSEGKYIYGKYKTDNKTYKFNELSSHSCNKQNKFIDINIDKDKSKKTSKKSSKKTSKKSSKKTSKKSSKKTSKEQLRKPSKKFLKKIKTSKTSKIK
jgi:hypothetical protein